MEYLTQNELTPSFKIFQNLLSKNRPRLHNRASNVPLDPLWFYGFYFYFPKSESGLTWLKRCGREKGFATNILRSYHLKMKKKLEKSPQDSTIWFGNQTKRSKILQIEAFLKHFSTDSQTLRFFETDESASDKADISCWSCGDIISKI